MIECSIGIMAYNEEANIGHLLEALLNQRTAECRIKEIWIVASGCTDRTEDIVNEYAARDRRIRLIVQERREGKASAINLFLSQADGNVFVLESADTIPESDTIENLVTPFSDPRVGMTGGHPVPLNSLNTFIGFTVNLLWRLHHRIALNTPKLGELIAFRSMVREIPPDTAVDEASIEAMVIAAGYRLKYVEHAVVYNKGPETIRDYLKQRRRITAGHHYLKKTQHYSVSTTSIKNILVPFVKDITWTGKGISWAAGAVLMEMTGRILGYYDYYIKKRNPFIWDTAETTKKLKGLSS